MGLKVAVQIMAIWFLGSTIGACSKIPLLLKPTTPPSPAMNLGDRLSWSIDVGRYVKDAELGPAQVLGEDLRPRLQRDLATAWSLTLKEGVGSPNAKWAAVLRLERFDVEMSKKSAWTDEWDFVARVRLGMEITQAGASASSVFTNAIDAERSRVVNLGMGGGADTGQVSIDLLLEAYRDAMIKLTSEPKLLAALGQGGGGVVAAEAPRPAASIVAVFDVQDSSGKFKQDALDQLTEYLSTKLTEGGRYKTLPRDQIRSRLKVAQTESYKQCYDQSCQIELGRTLAAQKSLATKLIRVGSRCAITSNLYDLKTETAELGASAETDCSDSGLMGALDQIARKLSSPTAP